MVVFSSAKPTVTAILVCPDAAKAKSATAIKAGAVETFLEVEIQLNRLATRMEAVCIKLEESNHPRFFGRDWRAKRPKTKLPMQKLCTNQLRRSKWLGSYRD